MKISQSTIRSRLKDTFGISYKTQKKSSEDHQNIKKLAITGSVLEKLEKINYELIFIDEFLLTRPFH